MARIIQPLILSILAAGLIITFNIEFTDRGLTGRVGMVSGSSNPVTLTDGVQIHACYGDPVPAHFRDYPSLDSASIKGAVLQGDWVTLTGRTTPIDGINWYEARNHSPLEPSAGGFPINYQSDANQLGWIADCFVE
ncbi:MAG: hypothetical protein AAFY26_17550 [Cyanobacteria bacterium J06638_22]